MSQYTKQLYALVSDQGTACAETCLCKRHYTKSRRARVENTKRDFDPPIPGSWVDVSQNDACACIECGAHHTPEGRAE